MSEHGAKGLMRYVERAEVGAPPRISTLEPPRPTPRPSPGSTGC